MVATGMVVTSQRAVEAMELCVANFVSHEGWSHFINCFICFLLVWCLGSDIIKIFCS